MTKSTSVAYYTRKIRLTERPVLLDELKNAPLRKRDYEFILDIVEGMQYKELSIKYCKSESRICKWKRELFEQLHQYDIRRNLC